MTQDEIKTMEAGRELDALVAEKVMGWTRPPIEGLPERHHVWHITDSVQSYVLPHFSDNITDAWLVMEKLYTDGWIVGIGSLAQQPRGWRCELCNMWAGDFERCPTDIEANADIAPLAICRAALLAVM